MRVRTRARELALQFLFQFDFQDGAYRLELDPFLDEELRETAAPEPAIVEVKTYARTIVDGVLEHREAIDAILTQAASNWGLPRMAAVDRNALRVGCYELMYADDVPTKVAINEAIELAKKFSTEASGAFVNGILDRIRKDQGLHA